MGESVYETMVYIAMAEETTKFRFVGWWLGVLKDFEVCFADLQGSGTNYAS